MVTITVLLENSDIAIEDRAPASATSVIKEYIALSVRIRISKSVPIAIRKSSVKMIAMEQALAITIMERVPASPIAWALFAKPNFAAPSVTFVLVVLILNACNVAQDTILRGIAEFAVHAMTLTLDVRVASGASDALRVPIQP